MNNKNKQKIIYITIAIVLMAIALVVVPIGINEFYKWGLVVDNPYITMWNAGNVLSFYGDVLGAIMTIFTVIMTIKYTTNQNIKAYKKEQMIKNNIEELEYVDGLKSLFLLEEFEKKPDDKTNFVSLFKAYNGDVIKFILEIENTNQLKEMNFKYTEEFNNQWSAFQDNTLNYSFIFIRKASNLEEDQEEYDKKLKEYQIKKTQDSSYSDFEHEKPKTQAELVKQLISELKVYRDENKKVFLDSYEKMLEINKNSFDEEIKKYI